MKKILCQNVLRKKTLPADWLHVWTRMKRQRQPGLMASLKHCMRLSKQEKASRCQGLAAFLSALSRKAGFSSSIQASACALCLVGHQHTVANSKRTEQ